MAPQQQLLSLLSGPTKATVTAALSGLAVDLALSSRSPARCYVVERLPYDDEVFTSMYGSPAARALASSKPKRPVGWVAVARLTAPGHLAVAFARNVGLAVLVRVNMWLSAALVEEERAEEEGREPQLPPLDATDLLHAGQRGGYNFCLEMATQFTRAALDARALQELPPALAKKLVKDLRLSAVRKARLPWHQRLVRVARTAAYSEATWWAADLLMACAQEVYAAVQRSAGKWEARARRCAQRCALHAARAAVVLAAVSLGNGLGAAMPRGRSFCMWLGPTAASFLVNGYAFATINRVAPLLLPPPGADGAGAPAAGAAAAPPPPATSPRLAQQQHADHGPLLMVAQQAHPAAAAAFAAAAAAGAAGAPDAAEQLANGVAELAGWMDGVAAAEQGGDGAAPAAAQQADAGVQAGAPGAAEPPIPAPQQRRVVGGPRLPDRPARRNAAAGPGPDGGAAPAAAGERGAPPPQAPHTPLYRDQRAPTPAADSEEAEARAAAAAASPAGSSTPAAPSPGSSTPAPAGSSSSTAAAEVQPGDSGQA